MLGKVVAPPSPPPTPTLTSALRHLCLSAFLRIGSNRFYDNIEDMIGYRPLSLIKWCWKVVTPGICAVRHAESHVWPLRLLASHSSAPASSAEAGPEEGQGLGSIPGTRPQANAGERRLHRKMVSLFFVLSLALGASELIFPIEGIRITDSRGS